MFRQWCLFGLLMPTLVLAGEIQIDQAWVREGPPNVSVLASYFTVQNHTHEPIRISAFSSDQFERIELHQTILHEGLARMQHQPCVLLGPAQSLVLAPGGYHLMLFNPKSTLKAGDTVMLKMHYTQQQNGQAMTFPAVVKKATGQAHHHH